MIDMIDSLKKLKTEKRSNLNAAIAMGVICVLAGIAALIFAAPAAVIAVVTVGWIYALAGISSVILAFQVRKFGGFWSPFIFGVLFLFGGLFMVFRPLVNVEIFTLLIGFMMGVTGVTKLVGCFTEKFGSKAMLFLSGTLSLICCFIILASWPLSGLWVIGTLVGVDLIFWGSTVISYAYAAKKL